MPAPPITTVTLQEAETQLARLVQQISESGEDVILTDGDKPVARLVAVPVAPSERPRPRFGGAKSLVTVPPDFDAPLEDFAEYM